MNITFDSRTERALDWLDGLVQLGVPERIAYKRAERRFGMDRKYLRALRSLRTGEANARS